MINNITEIGAIQSLVPNAMFHTDASGIVWHQDNTLSQPTQAEIDTELYRLKTLIPVNTANDRIRQSYEQAMGLLTNMYPEAEQKTWATQLTQARQFVLDPSVPVPALDALVAAKGTTATILAPIIIAKAESLELASMTLTGKYQKLSDELTTLHVSGAATQADYDAIVW